MSDSRKVVIKTVESQLVAASLGIIPNDREDAPPVIGDLLNKTYQYLLAQGASNFGNAICIYHDMESRNHQSIPIETIIPIYDKISADQEIWIYDLPKVEMMASIIHRGSLRTLEEAYNVLFEWIKKNNYQASGSIREVFLEYDENRNPLIMEVQVPVNEIECKGNTLS